MSTKFASAIQFGMSGFSQVAVGVKGVYYNYDCKFAMVGNFTYLSEIKYNY